MDSPSQSDRPTANDIAQILDAMWLRFLPDILERVAVLETASAALTRGSASASDCKAAEAAAHKLAGTLGTFSLKRGTDLARELETLFARENGPDPGSAPAIAASIAELRTMIENRPSKAASPGL